jgi:hypothetical protein
MGNQRLFAPPSEWKMMVSRAVRLHVEKKTIYLTENRLGQFLD